MDIRALVFNSGTFSRKDLGKMSEQELYELFVKDMEECQEQIQMYHLDEFSCAFNDEEISDQDYLYFVDWDSLNHITTTDKKNAVMDAARNHQFTNEIDEIDMLSYTERDENGEEHTFEDRFDYIDTTTMPITVHFICGTGYPDRNIPIGCLTDESIDKLYACIDK